MEEVVIQCPTCGPTIAAPGVCPGCGEIAPSHALHKRVVVPGPPMVIGDRLAKHYDWSLGKMVGSKAERKRMYKDAGMTMHGIADARAMKGIPRMQHQRVVNYSGMGNRKSSAERQRLA